eukprot:c17552_g1_i2.p2 GENE.c17552_g1_i2~~c17552_g1_i2.p2  ORF type:complete len:106 (-),score=22.67 c17552_g1_i2:472-759(-)
MFCCARKAKAGKPHPKIILAGPPAAGKGSLAERIRDEFGVEHISTGDLLRLEVASGSELGKRAQAKMEAGELVDDELLIPIVINKLKNPEVDRRG